jgi:hypothetical protein
MSKQQPGHRMPPQPTSIMIDACSPSQSVAMIICHLQGIIDAEKTGFLESSCF